MQIRVNNINPLELDFVHVDRNNARKLLGFAEVGSVQDFLGIVEKHVDTWKCDIRNWSPTLGETFMYIDQSEFCRLLRLFAFKKLVWIENPCGEVKNDQVEFG